MTSSQDEDSKVKAVEQVLGTPVFAEFSDKT